MSNLERQHLHFEPASVFLGQAIPPPKWLWENQLAEGCLTFLIGQPKSGKSSFVRSLIRSIALGESFMGFKTQACPIAYVALEDHESFLQESFRKADIGFDHVHLHYGSIVNSEIEKNISDLETLCVDKQIKLVVIDPMIKFLNIEDTNSYSEVYKKLTGFIKFARENKIHVMFVHHANKSKEESASQILGSTGLFGASDGALFITRKDKVGTIRSSLRYGDSLDKLQFGFDSKGLVTFSGAKADNDVELLSEKIVEYVKENPKQTIAELREYFKVRAEKLKEALEILFEAGSIKREGTGRSNSPYTFTVPDLSP